MVAKRQNNGQTSQQTLTQSPSIPPNAPPGAIAVTQPPPQSTPFYKIAPGEPITFAWNFSNLVVTPTHLTVSAACENGNTYPVGPTDGIIPGAATSIVWDTYAYQTSNPQLPLAQASYTLEIWGDRGPSAPPAPGLLAPNSAVHFALYTSQGYTPIASGGSCLGCSSAASRYGAASVGFIISSFVMLLSGSFIMRRL